MTFSPATLDRSQPIDATAQPLRYLAEDGSVVREPLPDFAADDQAIAALYRGLVLTRAFDTKAVALQRTGRLGTYASALGQEAVSVGLAAAMQAEDVLLPSFREHGAQLWRGVRPRELFLFWGGDERGNDFSAARHDFPNSVPVGSHLPHAVGVALSFRLRREPRVAVAVCGDGATSKGDFAEALNFAGVWQVPAVFVVCNNGWAISTPRAQQSAARTLAQKSVAAGIAGVQVDGNDVIAVRSAVSEAVQRARQGDGPGLIEAMTYRLADHTTSDDARRYRDDAEVSRRWHGEPIGRLRRFLDKRNLWNSTREEELLRHCRDIVEAAADDYLQMPLPAAAEMFEHLFAALPPELDRQRRSALALPEIDR